MTCLKVESNNTQATVVWTVVQSNIANDSKVPRSFEVIDNGDPSALNTSMDMYKDRGTDNNCGTDGNGTFEPLVRGNIVVSP